MSSPQFNFPHIQPSQAQKHVTANEATDLIDATLAGVAISATTAVAPANPDAGDIYILPAGASGFGAATPGQIATFFGGLWYAATPKPGWRWFVADQGQHLIYTPFGWLPGAVAGPQTGAALGLQVLDTTLTLSGPSTAALGLIPARAIVLGVTSWTISNVTGATAYRVGDGALDDRFGAALGVTPGASNVGVTGPFATYSDTDVVVTAEGPDFTGGQVGLAALLITPSQAPI